MPFIDEVRNIALNNEKEQAILAKLAQYKDILRENLVRLICDSIKEKIKENASANKVTNNTISGECDVHTYCRLKVFDKDLLALPKETLQEYLRRGTSEGAFYCNKFVSFIEITFSLMENSIENRLNTIQKQVGIFFKRIKTVKQKNLYCKFYTNELTSLISKVKERVLNDGIKIEDVFFEVGFDLNHSRDFEPFWEIINIENPIIRIPTDFYTRTSNKYYKQLFYANRDTKDLWIYNSSIVFKYSFSI